MTEAAITVSAMMKEAKQMHRTKKNVLAEDASKAAPHAVTASMAMTGGHNCRKHALPNHSSDLALDAVALAVVAVWNDV